MQMIERAIIASDLSLCKISTHITALNKLNNQNIKSGKASIYIPQMVERIDNDK